MAQLFRRLAGAVLGMVLPLSGMAEPNGAGPEGVAEPFSVGFGVNIHFTQARAGEMEMLAAAGCRWIRMDFTWGGTERKPGEYDFSAYERLLADLDRFRIRAIFILDYGNGLYDRGASPNTEEGRAAFAKWAAVAVTHFKDRGVVWEMWNEPNGGFWKPQANVDDYVKLSRATGRAIRAAQPREIFAGPATSGIDLKFIEACFKGGCLEEWDAVSCHPYRQSDPETAAREYRELRRLIAKYAPVGKTIPILSGEWGFSAAWRQFDEARQGKYLPRELLMNLEQRLPVSIWYDWHDDGVDAKEPEHHFGTVHHAYRQGEADVYEPKPAYVALKTLGTQLAGFHFSKRLMIGGPEDCILLFSRAGHGEKDPAVKLAVWTTAKEPHAVTLPLPGMRVSAVTATGQSMGDAVEVADAGYTVALSDEVAYVLPEKANDFLQLTDAMSLLPLEVFSRGPGSVKLTVTLRNPLDHAIMVRPIDAPEDFKDVTVDVGGQTVIEHVVTVSRSSESKPVTVGWRLATGQVIAQQTTVIATNPLSVEVQPPTPAAAGSDRDSLPVRVIDPSGEGFKGKLTLTGIEGLETDPDAASGQAVELKPGEFEATVRIKVKIDGADFSTGVQVTDASGALLVEAPHANYIRLPDLATDANDGSTNRFELRAEGDGKIASEQMLSVAAPAVGPPAPGMGVLKLVYKKSTPGWKFWSVTPLAPEARQIEGEPRAMGLWVYGDASGAQTRLRFTDSTEQTFQPSSLNITWTGWKYIEFPMRAGGPEVSYWGGAKDGVIHYPIHWDAIFLLDRDSKKPAVGEVYIGGPMLVRDGTTPHK